MKIKMPKTNMDVRIAAKEAGVYLWEIADRLGVGETTFTKHMRRELDAETKARIFAIIAEIAAEEKEEI